MAIETKLVDLVIYLDNDLVCFFDCLYLKEYCRVWITFSCLIAVVENLQCDDVCVDYIS